jgi:cytochrome b561
VQGNGASTLKPKLQLADTRTGYGWISIGLHWLTAILVVVMLFVGNSIPGPDGVYADKLRLHTSLAFVFYIALWFRIYWRFAQGHPGPLPRQTGVFFLIGKYLHFSLLVALAGMLVSGPVMAWAGGFPVEVFSAFTLPPMIGLSPTAFVVSHTVHVACATYLALGVLVHMAGAAKHFFINNDGTIDKILIVADPAANPAEPELR